jgi:cytoskeletal protein RodZ
VEEAPISVTLREARLRQGLAISDCAEATRIRERYLVAIEDGRYESLPDPAYVQGFVRAYAAHLGVRVEGPVRELPVPPAAGGTPRGRVAPHRDTTRATARRVGARRGRRRGWAVPVAIVVVVVVVVAALVGDLGLPGL